MRMPGFTAEAAVHGMRGAYGRHPVGRPGGDPARVVPAYGTTYVDIDDTLFCCEPCMSGGPSGALVTYCCDPCASIPGGMSHARTVVSR